MESTAPSTAQEEKNHTSDNEAFVPVLSQLTEAYHDTNGNIKGKHIPRFRNLTNRFKQLYGVEPAFFCRAPGRVNIIGEHIDYCGYSVLPAAIEQDFIMAYIPSDKAEIEISNIDKDQYPSEKISTDPF